MKPCGKENGDAASLFASLLSIHECLIFLKYLRGNLPELLQLKWTEEVGAAEEARSWHVELHDSSTEQGLQFGH